MAKVAAAAETNKNMVECGGCHKKFPDERKKLSKRRIVCTINWADGRKTDYCAVCFKAWYSNQKEKNAAPKKKVKSGKSKK